MDTTTTSTGAAEPSTTNHRVRTDLGAGIALLAVVIGGNLLWRLSDAGVLATLAGR